MFHWRVHPFRNIRGHPSINAAATEVNEARPREAPSCGAHCSAPRRWRNPAPNFDRRCSQAFRTKNPGLSARQARRARRGPIVLASSQGRKLDDLGEGDELPREGVFFGDTIGAGHVVFVGMNRESIWSGAGFGALRLELASLDCRENWRATSEKSPSALDEPRDRNSCA